MLQAVSTRDSSSTNRAVQASYYDYYFIFIFLLLIINIIIVITQIPGNDKIMLCIAKTQGNRKYKHTAAASSRWLTDVT